MSERNASPPQELEYAMRAAVDNKTLPSAAELLEAAERLLDRVLRTDCESRESALDLLTVDALMTRALAIAAKDPNLLEEFPEQAMQRVASHGRDQS
jgi:hypothetical protein